MSEQTRQTKIYEADDSLKKRISAHFRSYGNSFFSWSLRDFMKKYCPELETYARNKEGEVVAVCGPRPEPHHHWQEFVDENSSSDERRWKPSDHDEAEELRKEWGKIGKSVTCFTIGEAIGLKERELTAFMPKAYRTFIEIDSEASPPEGATEIPKPEFEDFDRKTDANSQAVESFNDDSMLIDSIIWIAAANHGSTLSEPLEEFFEQSDEAIDSVLPVKFSGFVDEDDEDGEFEDEDEELNEADVESMTEEQKEAHKEKVSDLRRRKAERFRQNRWRRTERIGEFLFEEKINGFLVSVNVPVYDYDAEGKSAGFSMGHTYFQTFYGETVEDAVEKAKVWAEERKEFDRQRGIEEGKSKKAEEKSENAEANTDSGAETVKS